jgi:hypothetical protein
MSALWAAAAACILIATFCCRLLIVSRLKIGVVPDWLGPALFVAMLFVASVVFVASSQAR